MGRDGRAGGESEVCSDAKIRTYGKKNKRIPKACIGWQRTEKSVLSRSAAASCMQHC